MQLLSPAWATIRRIKSRAVDPSSLKFRLTVEILLLTGLGLGSIALWAGWKMQQILIVSHQQQVEYIIDRFPGDLELYSDMLPLRAGLAKTIANVAKPKLQIWVKDPPNTLIASSSGLDPSTALTQELISLAEMPLMPQVYRIGDRYLVLCARPLLLKGKPLGRVYMALDVTPEQEQLMTALRGLVILWVLVMILTLVAIALRIGQALQPLQTISQRARMISVADLNTDKLILGHAPTEVKELSQAFNIMLSRLSDAWEQQREFVSNISHELRTPLTVVLGYLQSLLRRSENLSDYQREALETAASEADRTVRLLQDLLDLSRFDSGYIPFHLETIVLNDLVIEVTSMAEKVSRRSMTVIAPTEVKAIADRDRLRQVLLNLIDNAVKYSSPTQAITLNLQQSTQGATLEVCDLGIGIPLQNQNRVFERFYRVDESRSRSTGGYGLGLAIAKTLVEGMGGTISVRSQPSQGSIFTITLPSPVN
jgi:signal transduction histidine kinase